MKERLWIACFLLLFLCLSSNSFAGPQVVHIFLDGTIHPITAEYVTKGIDYATENHAAVVIFQIQTPGGLSESMRTIISKMINSSVPVIVYVAPSGSRATSAGV